MRKLLLAIGFLGLAATSQAALVQCTPNQATTVLNGSVVPGGVVFTCGPVGVDGDDIFISTLQLQVSGIAATNTGATGPVGAIFEITSTTLPVGFAGFNGTSCEAVGAPNDQGQAAGVCAQFSVAIDAGLVDSIPAFDVTVVSSNPTAPASLAFSGSASVFYNDVTASAVPEPSSMALLGGSLIGLGLIARKRRQK